MELGDSLVTILAIVLAVVLMLGVPVVMTANSNDNIAQQKVQTATAQLLHDISTTGAITQDRLDSFIQEINATGNTFDIEMEIQILDQNPSKKVTQVDSTKIGENVYYTIYTTQILDEFENKKLKNEPLKKVLKEGDIITIRVKNTNRTMAQVLADAFQGGGFSNVKVYASGSEVVITNGK